jgi:hypothetical protein
LSKDNQPAETIYSRRQPAWHLVVLSVFTFGVYNYYWFYKNLMVLHELPPDGKGEYFCIKHPAFSSFLFFLPIVDMIMQFFALIGAIAPNKQSLFHNHATTCGFLLALAFGALVLLGLLPEPYHLFYLASCLPLALAQRGLNNYWQANEKAIDPRTGEIPLVRAAFNPIELVVIFLGAAFLGLCVVGPSVLPAVHH